jgi:4-aminobutyrate aminotransferase-like enzyme
MTKVDDNRTTRGKSRAKANEGQMTPSPLRTTRSQQLLKRLQAVECPDTTFVSDAFPVVLKKGRGCMVTDVDGNRYADMTACFGVLALGHRPASSVQAIRKQSSQLLHAMGDVHPTDTKVHFLEALARVLPFHSARIILGNSGGESIEAGMKTALLVTGRSRFLVFSGGYHGLHFGALQMTTGTHFKELRPGFNPFGQWGSTQVKTLPFPLVPDYSWTCGEPLTAAELAHTEPNCSSPEECLAELNRELAVGDVAAVLVEPVQGRAGERVFPNGFLAQVKSAAAQAGSLLIFDEIYTGFGRTGTFFALENEHVVPDLLCLGKALGGGLPLSVCAGDLVGQWPTSMGEARHTSTFLGHPLACATGRATIKALQREFPALQAQLPQWNAALHQFLNSCRNQNLPPHLSFEIRGRGWMRGFWFYRAPAGFAATLSTHLLAEGYITLPSGTSGRVLGLTPPLNMDVAVLKKFLNVLGSVLEKHR